MQILNVNNYLDKHLPKPSQIENGKVMMYTVKDVVNSLVDDIMQDKYNRVQTNSMIYEIEEKD